MRKTKKHCCWMMAYKVNYLCEQHPDTFDCADNLIYYSKQHKRYGIIIHDGGSSWFDIKFCPWCGKELTKAKKMHRRIDA